MLLAAEEAKTDEASMQRTYSFVVARVTPSPNDRRACAKCGDRHSRFVYSVETNPAVIDLIPHGRLDESQSGLLHFGCCYVCQPALKVFLGKTVASQAVSETQLRDEFSQRVIPKEV